MCKQNRFVSFEKVFCLCLACLTLFLTNTPWAFAQTIELFDASVEASTLLGPSRQIMRLSDGRIFTSLNPKIGDESSVRLFAAIEDQTWKDVTGDALPKNVSYVSSDTGSLGTYVGYVNQENKGGEIAFFPDPIGNPGRAVVSKTLTPIVPTIEAADTVIAASKGEDSVNTVAYAWRDKNAKRIYLGVSKDGTNFDTAKVIVKDSGLSSPPAIAIHNSYILVSYLTRNPRVIGKSSQVEGRSLPAFVESWDGGTTWTSPKPVFGKSIQDFPKLASSLKPLPGEKFSPRLFAAGGSRDLGNSLAWAQPEIGARIFVLTEQAVVSDSPEINSQLKENRPFAGVVTFKDLSDGSKAKWQHVVASEYIADPLSPSAGQVSNFNYSALPGTTLRAVAYKEKLGDQEEVVVSISTNTGKTFDRFVKFPAKDFGLSSLAFTTSSCLRKTSKGEVSLDVALLSEGGKDVAIKSLPLNINLAELPPSMFNNVTRWP